MKTAIALIELEAAAILFILGMYFYKIKDTNRGVLFLTGDYSELDKKKVCHSLGKRFMVMSVPFWI